MKKSISEIATLMPGVYTPPSLSGGGVYYLQARHFDEDRNLQHGIVPALLENDFLQNSYLIPGDILVAIKGKMHFAVCYHGDMYPAVASSVFIVLRLAEHSQILPLYLTWYLNCAATQMVLGAMAKGTSLLSITKADLAGIIVPIPALKVQERIVKVHELRLREKVLTKEIITKKEKLIEQLLYKSAIPVYE